MSTQFKVIKKDKYLNALELMNTHISMWYERGVEGLFTPSKVYNTFQEILKSYEVKL